MSDSLDEIEALTAIYGPENVVVQDQDGSEGQQLKVTVSLLDQPDIFYALLIKLPALYPASKPPRIHIDSKYIGSYAVDPTLFGSVLRLFMAQDDAWTPGAQVLFQGIEAAKELCQTWYNDHASASLARELAHAKEPPPVLAPIARAPTPDAPASDDRPLTQFTASDPITDRRSVFIAFAARLDDPAQVPVFLGDLKQDKKIAKATHNILAWKCGSASDNDDDGETAAGRRLAHLLQILGVDQVFLVVTRWGPDRFKHISAAGRDALDKAGFLKAQPRKK